MVELEGTVIGATLWNAAYQMALIDYAKPFKQSRGKGKRKHILPFPPLSADDVELHKKLLDLRDTFLAHSDISAKDAMLYVNVISGQPLPMIASNTDPLLPSLAVVKAHVERILDVWYLQGRRCD